MKKLMHVQEYLIVSWLQPLVYDRLSLVVLRS